MLLSVCSSPSLIQITSENTAPYSTANHRTKSKKVTSYTSQQSHLVGLEGNNVFSRHLGQDIQILNPERVIRHYEKF